MSTPAHPSGRRVWIRRAFVTLTAIAGLYLGTTFVLSRFLDPEALAAWLEPRLEEALNRDVEVGGVDVALFPLGIRLEGLTVADPTGLAPALVQLRSLDLRVEILPLFRREVRVSRLAVEGLLADLRASQDGSTNFGDLSTRQPTPVEGEPATGERAGGPEPGSVTHGTESEGPRPFRLNLRSIRLLDNRIRYIDAAGGITADAEALRLRASARQAPDGGWLLVGSSDARLTLQRGESPPLLLAVPLGLAFDVETDDGVNWVRIRTGELRVDRIALGLEGEIQNLKDPVRTVSLGLRGEGLPLPDLMALLPDSLRRRIPGEAEGTLAADLRIQGEAGPGHIPAVTGRVDLTEGRLTLDGSRIAEGLTAVLGLNADRSIQAQLQGTALDGPLSVEGLVSMSDRPIMDLVLRSSPDLGRLGSVIRFPEGVTASGQVAAQLRIAGPLGRLQDLRFNGDVRGTNIRATHPGLAVPVAIPEGEIRLVGIQAELSDLFLLLGDQPITVSGRVPDVFAFLDPLAIPRFQGSVRGSRLDLRTLGTRPLPDSSLTYGKVAFAKVGGRPLGGRAFQDAARELGLSRPDSLPLTGTLELALDTVIDRQGRMEDVRARVEFGPSFIRIPEATLRQFGGEVRTSLDLTLEPDAEAPFSLNLSVRDLDAGGFLDRTTPLGRFVRGRMTLELDLIGTLDGFLLPDRPSLVGSGSFAVAGGGLASSPVTRALADFLGMESLREPSVGDWESSFVLDHGWVRLAQATIQGAPGSPRVGGNLGLGGELDLQSIFDLPVERLSSGARERLGVAGEIASNVLQRPDLVQAILHIGGSVFDPAIQADPAATARILGQAVEDEVRREVQEQIDAQKAEAERILAEQQAEAQRRIQEQKDQLRSRASGFLRSLVQRQDTVRTPPPPDSARMLPPVTGTPPDTLQPDTTRPDTTRPDTLRPDTLRPDTTRPDTTRPDTTRPDTLREISPFAMEEPSVGSRAAPGAQG